MTLVKQLNEIKNKLPDRTRLVAVSKFHPATKVREAYEAGQRIFGESRVQEIVTKQAVLPDDIAWHFIGHLQTNKIKQLMPFVHTIESVDSYRLLQEIDRQAVEYGRTINVLLQIHIAAEETKFGFSYEECRQMLFTQSIKSLGNTRICGLMGMATFTENKEQVRSEFAGLAEFFRELKSGFFKNEPDFKEISMGMSDDYPLAVEEGSTLIRIGSKIFGERIP